MFGSHILAASTKYDLNPRLLAAVIYVESRGYPYSFRPEPNFHNRYIKGKSDKVLGGHFPEKVSKQAELALRACSIGLMQIMGQTAREHGFQGESLLELISPAQNIELGARILKRFLEEKDGNVHEALLRWNGGGDSSYPSRVIDAFNKGEVIEYLAI